MKSIALRDRGRRDNGGDLEMRKKEEEGMDERETEGKGDGNSLT
jgi:hypothetical protein